MIINQAGFYGEAYLCDDGKWRIKTPLSAGYGSGPFPFYPDGFDTRHHAETWWISTSRPIACRVCGLTFFAARDDAEFCTPKCRAKYNRHQQGASEHAFTGAYYQRPEDDRSHTKQADTFEYQCAWCGKTNTARAEAKRAGKREAQYCNDNGGKCRQAAYRQRRKDAQGPNPKYQNNAGQSTHGQYTTPPPPTTNKDTRHSSQPSHTGKWLSRSEAVQFMIKAFVYIHKIPAPAWAQHGDYKEVLAWARKYLKENHPDVTGKPATSLYKSISDCYSYLRKAA